MRARWEGRVLCEGQGHDPYVIPTVTPGLSHAALVSISVTSGTKWVALEPSGLFNYIVLCLRVAVFMHECVSLHSWS